jgi:hypothetical protein
MYTLGNRRLLNIHNQEKGSMVMVDKLEWLDSIQPGATAKRPSGVHTATESDEESCPAFGFLRGNLERAVAIEFRFRDGNSETFSYSHLVSWKFNPSKGLLLKFTSDVTTLVLIAGSNLDTMPPGKAINLTDRGLQRHRITHIREMDEDELRLGGKDVPTIDNIKVADFQSHEEHQEWLNKNAAVFLRK